MYSPAFSMRSIAEMRTLCRFCLGCPPQMQPLDPEQLISTDIPEMFAIVTGMQLDISSLHSEFMCQQCEKQMRTVYQIRTEFLRVDQLWKLMIAKCKADYPNHHSLDDPLNGTNASKPMYEDSKKVPTIIEFIEYKAEPSDFSDSEIDWMRQDENVPDTRYTERTQPFLNKQMNRQTSDKLTKSSDTILECDICGEKTTKKRLMRTHMIENHICSKTTQNPAPHTFDTKSTTVVNKWKRLNVPTTCPVCGKTNIKRKSMIVHIRMHENRDRYKCAHCPRGFERLLSLQQHERQHTGERPFICEICAFSFTSNAGLRNHLKLHALATADNPIKPPMSAKVQRLPTVLAKPAAKIQLQLRGVRPECPLCRSTFANRSSILGHMKLQHGAEGLLAWKNMIESTCMVCYEKFPSKDELDRHRTIHFQHHCHICPRHFHNKVSLDTHVQMHSTKSRPFKCELCECAYTSATMLKIHFRRAHTDERPFECSECGRTFAEKSELSTHTKRVHFRPAHHKRYDCTWCPSQFRSKTALRAHTENHTGEYRFWCGICKHNQHSGPQLAEHNRMYHDGAAVHSFKSSIAEREGAVEDGAALKLENRTG